MNSKGLSICMRMILKLCKHLHMKGATPSNFKQLFVNYICLYTWYMRISLPRQDFQSRFQLEWHSTRGDKTNFRELNTQMSRVFFVVWLLQLLGSFRAGLHECSFYAKGAYARLRGGFCLRGGLYVYTSTVFQLIPSLHELPTRYRLRRMPTQACARCQ